MYKPFLNFVVSPLHNQTLFITRKIRFNRIDKTKVQIYYRVSSEVRIRLYSSNILPSSTFDYKDNVL